VILAAVSQQMCKKRRKKTRKAEPHPEKQQPLAQLSPSAKGPKLFESAEASDKEEFAPAVLSGDLTNVFVK